MVNTPIPHSLKSEAKKAAKILRDFTVSSAKTGPDRLIPAGLIVNAKGLAIITVCKLGFLVTARAGSGIVIAKTGDDGVSEWSAPSAIAIAGLGGGFEIGAEVTDFVFILNTQAAVEAFSKGGNFTLGGNFTIAAGPLGRNIEADISLRSPAAMYTYSKTKGIFAGISIEGSAIIERKDANKKFYGQDIRAYQILSGEVARPGECAALYDVLSNHETALKNALMDAAKREGKKHAEQAGAMAKDAFIAEASSYHSSSSVTTTESRSTGRGATFIRRTISSRTTTTKENGGKGNGSDYSEYGAKAFKAVNTEKGRSMALRAAQSDKTRALASSAVHSEKGRSMALDAIRGDKRRSKDDFDLSSKAVTTKVTRSSSVLNHKSPPTSNQSAKSESGFTPRTGRGRVMLTAPASNKTTNKPTVVAVSKPGSGKAKAMFDFDAQMSCDLSFKLGDEIQILTRTKTQNDWWEGCCHGKTGIFPANYVWVLI